MEAWRRLIYVKNGAGWSGRLQDMARMITGGHLPLRTRATTATSRCALCTWFSVWVILVVPGFLIPSHALSAPPAAFAADPVQAGGPVASDVARVESAGRNAPPAPCHHLHPVSTNLDLVSVLVVTGSAMGAIAADAMPFLLEWRSSANFILHEPPPSPRRVYLSTLRLLI